MGAVGLEGEGSKETQRPGEWRPGGGKPKAGQRPVGQEDKEALGMPGKQVEQESGLLIPLRFNSPY